MESGPSIDSNDGAIDSASLVPTSAAPDPDCALKVCLDVLIVIPVGICSDFYGAD